MGEFSKSPNIGAKVEEQLNEVGIFNYEALCQAGVKDAWLKIQSIDFPLVSIAWWHWKVQYVESRKVNSLRTRKLI